MTEQMTEVVASRSLEWRGDDGSRKKVEVEIGKPAKWSNSNDMYCPFQILGIGPEKLRFAVGVDSAQALQLAMKILGAELGAIQSELHGKLLWTNGDPGDTGF